MKKYDIFLFDADGTLYDYNKAEAHALKATFKHYNFDYSENVRLKYREINAEVWHSYEQGEISKDELKTVRFVRLFDVLGIKCNIHEFSEEYMFELGKCAFLIDGALEICKAIVSHGKQLFIVTNGVVTTQDARIKHSPIEEYISAHFISEVIGHQKPRAEYFEHVFSHLPQAPKDTILIIGDSLSADIAGGNNAGIDSCWFNEHGIENRTKIKPTYEIIELSELQNFI